MRRRVLRRLIWGYSVWLCPIKKTSSLYGLSKLYACGGGGGGGGGGGSSIANIMIDTIQPSVCIAYMG